jgi:hypothetical protein
VPPAAPPAKVAKPDPVPPKPKPSPETPPLPLRTSSHRELHSALERLAPGDQNFAWAVMAAFDPPLSDIDPDNALGLALELEEIYPSSFVSHAACARWIQHWRDAS